MKTQCVLLVALAAGLPAQAIQAPFNVIYTVANVGPVPGLPTNYGAITFDRNDPNTLICSKWNTTAVQNLYRIRVVRDAGGHVTGFTGTAAAFAQADYIDGGLDHHPSGVLFYSRYPFIVSGNSIGQFKPGSTVPDRTDPILGPNYIGGLAIVPAGLPGAGRLKTLRWSGGGWSDAQLTPDGNGTFNIVGETITQTITGGPDGFTYVPRTAPLFTGADVLIAEFNTGNLATYAIDATGDPIVATRQTFLTGFTGAFSLTVDPVSQDILHADWSAGTIHVIRGFGLGCGQCSHYGNGLAGTNGRIPEITWLACPRSGESTGAVIGNGLPGALGLVAAGFTQTAIPLVGGTLLNEAAMTAPHFLSTTGRFTLSLAVPPTFSNVTVRFQAFYLDAGAVQGVSMSNGFHMPIL